MNHRTSDGAVGLHLFHKNNELAGYCSVLQALELAGLIGHYGRRLNAVVIGFGADPAVRARAGRRSSEQRDHRRVVRPGDGFSWARPTGFDEPAFVVGDNVLYYAVDHSPSYLWNSATWENSNALMPFLRRVLEGGTAWDADETLGRAIELRDGKVVNSAILAFQGREAEPPHRMAMPAESAYLVS